MLHGEELRSELRRICDPSYVTPERSEEELRQCVRRDQELVRHKENRRKGNSALKSAAHREKMRAGQKALREAFLADRPDGCLTRQEIADRLRVGVSGLDSKLSQRRVPRIKPGRFTWYHIDALKAAGIL